MRVDPLQKVVLAALLMLAAVGCGAPEADDPELLAHEEAVVEQQASASTGSFLFTKETFMGNGRTCSTCHPLTTGTLSPAAVQSRYSANPSDPLFRSIDSDDGMGTSYTKLKTDATVRVTLTLPPNIRLAATPSVRTVTLRRGIPSTLDSPALDPVLMWDGREATLQSQARSAILDHAAARRLPTQSELDDIALFEKSLFSSSQMSTYAQGGAAPALPAGTTDSEKRGRAFFAPAGLCGGCHNGPLLNAMSEFNPVGAPQGERFGSAFVSEFNLAGAPVRDYIVTNPDGTETLVSSPDPGLMLVTGKAEHANLFKMVSLRNLKNTAPYFHDNSAKTLEAVMAQYKLVMQVVGAPLTDQDIADIIAFMKLL